MRGHRPQALTCAVAAALAFGLACAGREPEAPNVCPRLFDSDPAPAGYDDALRAVEGGFLGRTNLAIRCGSDVYRLRLDIPPLDDPKRFTPRGRCRMVLADSGHGTLVQKGAQQQFGDEVPWDLTATEDGRFYANVHAIPLGITLEHEPSGTWIGRATACEGRPSVCSGMKGRTCTITASR